ncbi:hypothetical protein PPL_00332 [Heterostelium album PN500]|uniref:Conserved oligomeric Golgi complex subunit 4 C-terminal domain-containing protein n=1 Tax=Heterostelium pallidum (strain ATCC 26659 / Pp 5 / PN500) TaxID=670386 RepID=D3AW61_HETP5|nr:hypothetical protein PPL_00332 [Heterostelium album PN500]EFA86534.1 hypothetical protein PPL_00332 [Heterostelium album PN500]|eukprot:XP_020438639.1 hypothetical protein PPL_00332 [Heterostelium album PN500]
MDLLLKQTYSGDFDKKRDYFLVILNDLSLTTTYIDQMQRELIGMTNHKFEDQDEINMIIMCINGDSFKYLKNRMDTLLKDNIDKIVQILSIPINQLIWPINNIIYEISNQDYEKYEINDPFAQDFIEGLTNLLLPYKSIMLENIFDILIHKLSTHVALTLEDHIKQKKFNFLGSIQLSKDIRKIIDHLTQITAQQNVRHKFVRLQQIVHILTMDKVTDILEYWGQEGYQWKLSALEIKLILARRSDFPIREYLFHRYDAPSLSRCRKETHRGIRADYGPEGNPNTAFSGLEGMSPEIELIMKSKFITKVVSLINSLYQPRYNINETFEASKTILHNAIFLAF